MSANLIVVAISTRLPDEALPVQFVVMQDTRIARAAGLTRSSVVDCGVIATVAKSLVQRKIGSFPPEAMVRIDQCLKISLALD